MKAEVISVVTLSGNCVLADGLYRCNNDVSKCHRPSESQLYNEQIARNKCLGPGASELSYNCALSRRVIPGLPSAANVYLHDLAWVSRDLSILLASAIENMRKGVPLAALESLDLAGWLERRVSDDAWVTKEVASSLFPAVASKPR